MVHRLELALWTALLLGVLSNAVMAWNTMHMQRAVDEIEARSGQAVDVAGLRRIAPTHLDGINLRGTFDFPLAPYAHRVLPSSTPDPTTYRRFSA